MALISLEEFIEKWLGKKCDFDGYYGGQCVDLYRQYVKEVLGFKQSPGVGGAAEIWDSADPKLYDFIDNTPVAIVEKGDIPIWNRRAGGGFGHVDIVIEKGTVNSFLGLDQNWPTLDMVTKTSHNYTNVIGWLRPKKENMADTIVVSKNDWDKVFQNSLTHDATCLYLGISKVAKDVRIEDIRRAIGERESSAADSARKQLTEDHLKEIKTLREDYEQKIKELSNITPPETPDIPPNPPIQPIELPIIEKLINWLKAILSRRA